MLPACESVWTCIGLPWEIEFIWSQFTLFELMRYILTGPLFFCPLCSCCGGKVSGLKWQVTRKNHWDNGKLICSDMCSYRKAAPEQCSRVWGIEGRGGSRGGLKSERREVCWLCRRGREVTLCHPPTPLFYSSNWTGQPLLAAPPPLGLPCLF